MSTDLPGGSMSSLTLGDVNGDGHLDLLVAKDGQANQLMLNNGAGGFHTSTDLPVCHPPRRPCANTRSLTLGDVNGDGHLDLIVGNYGETNQLQLNDGTGGFT